MDRMMDIGEVATCCGVSQRSIMNWVAAGKFPVPIKLTRRCVRWPELEVMAHIEARRAAVTRPAR